MRSVTVLFGTSLVFAAFGDASGQVTFIGPLPYRSAADSPFDFSGSTFYFEDFEDGEFNLPPGVTSLPYLVKSPSATTDSVDGDDGLIDGFGTDGHSLVPNAGYAAPTYPVTWMQEFSLDFDAVQLGFLPNVLGFVWTDGRPISGLQVVAYDQDGNWTSRYFESSMDGSDMGETGEDLFIGLRSINHIRGVTVINGWEGGVLDVDYFELDHVQFGVALVPEPSFFPFAAAWVLLVLLDIIRFRPFVRKGLL